MKLNIKYIIDRQIESFYIIQYEKLILFYAAILILSTICLSFFDILINILFSSLFVTN